MRKAYKKYSVLPLVLLALMLTLGACSTTQVKSTRVAPLDTATTEVDESELLDVGINLFDPGLSAKDKDDVYPEVRQGEARYFPVILMNTMQRSAHWGAVRVVPSDMASVDVHVRGKILRSDGEKISLSIEVEDSTGKQWFRRKYSATASQFVYSKTSRSTEPFQGLYNEIANDIAAYQKGLDTTSRHNIRTVAELKFAQAFSPQAFGGHLSVNKKGIYTVQRLPAELDPMLARVRKIRDRDYLFVDTLQDYYGVFSRKMDEPYQEWRERSYDEVIAIRELKRSSTLRTLGGIAAILGGIAAASSGNRSTNAAGNVAIYGGAILIGSGVNKRSEASLHVEALAELGDSLSADITPQILKLDDQTVTLTGSVEDQYEQWREILRKIYEEEVGLELLDAEQAGQSMPAESAPTSELVSERS